VLGLLALLVPVLWQLALVVLPVLLVPVLSQLALVVLLVPVQFLAQQTLADRVLALAPSPHLYPAFSSDCESHAMSSQLKNSTPQKSR